MIQLKYRDLNSKNLLDVLTKMSRVKGLPIQTTYRIMKIKSAVESEIKHGQELYQNILKRNCELDEQGIPKPEMAKKEDGSEFPIPGSFLILKGNEEAYKKDLEDFLSIEIIIDKHKLSLEDLKFFESPSIPVEQHLSAEDCAALDPVVNWEPKPNLKAVE